MRQEVDRLLTIGEVAKIFRCSLVSVRRWTAAKQIPAPLKIGASLRWRTSDIEQAIADHATYAMVGGGQKDFDVAEPVIQAYAKAVTLLGAAGAGQLTKMVNQICIAGLVQGLSEGLHFAQKAGLDGAAVVDVISGGAAGSWQMANRYETMLADQFEHGFAVDWMRKDLAICLKTADEVGASLPVTALVDQFYKDVQKLGGGRWDTSSLIKRLNAAG